MVDDASAPFSARVLSMVRLIPYGKVTSYGDVAALLGAPRAARGVGHVLSGLPQGTDVPWWRVMNARGEVSIQHVGGRLQRLLLEQEGVRFDRGGRVDLRKFKWRPSSADSLPVAWADE